jgi:hypothetical protein
MNTSFISNLWPSLKRWCAGGFRPVAVLTWEWTIMRVLLALLVVTDLQEFKPFTFTNQPDPRGLSHAMDLSFLGKEGTIDLSSFDRIDVPGIGMLRFDGPGWFDTMLVLSLILGVMYASGRFLKVCTPLLALVHLLPWTLSNSQGFTHHGHQLVTMVLLVQSAVLFWWAWRKPSDERGLPLRSYLVYYTQGMVAVSYVTCAVTKLLATRGTWLWTSNNICIELVKSHRLQYYGDLDAQYAGDPTAAMWLLQHPWTTRLLFDAGFCLELLAIVALRDRRWALIMGLSIIAFHRSVWWLMKLEFPNHEALIVIFLVNVPFWIWWLAKGRTTHPLAAAQTP